MASQTISVTLGATTLQVVRDPAATNVMEVYSKTNIVAVVPVFNQRPMSPPVSDQEWDYPYPTMTIINIYVLGMQHAPIRLELQDVSNQATWNTGLLTGIQQALTDIAAWMI